MDTPIWALGLMSGTSLDGIDAALLKTDGHHIEATGDWLTLPYSEPEKTKLRDAIHGRGDLKTLEQELTRKHAQAVESLLKKSGMHAKDINVIGFHGQTVDHRPHEGITTQLGDGALLAKLTGIDVVNDFRKADVLAGGQGAPLVPLYHAALAENLEKPVAILNIGGIANVTWIGEGDWELGIRDSEEKPFTSPNPQSPIPNPPLLAFDTGPGNALINDWAHSHTGSDCDHDGKLALAGKCNKELLNLLLSEPFFSKKPPKSLDRNHFLEHFLQHFTHISPEDGAATLAEFTAAAVHKACDYLPQPPKQWLICGGGRHNPVIMAALARHLPCVRSVDALNWHGDALEAQAFAFLAVRSLKGLPLSLPNTTGVQRPTNGGVRHRAGIINN